MEKVLRLTKLIAKQTKAVGSPHRLEKLINDENARAQTRWRVSRRTLAKLAKLKPSQDLLLRLSFLRALDVYLAPQGEGLADKPLFEKKGILETLVERPNVSFLLGSKPRPRVHRNDLSRWDARSLAELLSAASRFNLHMEFDIEDVLWRTPMTARQASSETWYQLLDNDRRSLVAIGSPLANHASEIILSKIFGVNAFEPPSARSLTASPLPFYFCWPPMVSKNYHSAFGLTWQEVARKDRRLANQIRKNRAYAFVLDGKFQGVPVAGERRSSYGVIVAQRRSGGNIWLVVSGLTGPATFAAARLAKRVDAELPWVSGQDSPVLWWPVWAIVGSDPTMQGKGDNREVKLCRFLGKPRLWPEAAQGQ